MSASYQRATDSGAEPGHPIQAPTDKKVAEQGISEKAQSRPDVAGDENAADQPAAPNQDYPEQKHAGKVGYGPNYAEARGRVTMGEKIDGLKEEMKGKLKHDQHLVQEGHDKRTGELKRHQMEEDNNPKAIAAAKPDDSENPGNATESERQGSGIDHENVQAEQRKADEEAKDRNDRQVQERVESQVNAGDRAEMPQ
ncbi:hypothetical protein M407DRAFT_240764 [Tulasnella calospora MUT 4182]|uniref:Uncharacterized protein n=1 Tax=Tulasnella calospora MUT 4182 TaxID=1051891 RepID=A0A0C3QY74_9AGAM|nr:hypothetical protein M407DRAFT_240764 [Tulasnella calospora MUT 4182]